MGPIVHMKCTRKMYAYNEFSYCEHSATTSRIFSQRRRLLIDINVRKVWM